MQRDTSSVTSKNVSSNSSRHKDTKMHDKKKHKFEEKIKHNNRFSTDKHPKFPNGYVEAWAGTKVSSNSVNTQKDKSSPESINNDLHGFNPISVSLLVENNTILNKDNNYEIRFSTGIRDGTGATISETGKFITFHNDGSYQFEICGEATLFSDVDVSLIYHSDKFTSDIKPFTVTKIPTDEGKIHLRGIPTILPIQKGQMIRVKLVPTPDESIMLLGGTRLLIHRVA